MFVKLDPANQRKAVNAEVVRVVEAVNPELLDSLDMEGLWIKQLKEVASRAELNQIREGLRPLGERSFDDSIARYMFSYFPDLGVKNPDITHVIDEFERLKDEEWSFDLKRVLNFDATILCKTMSASNVDQLDRLLRIESDTIAGQQSVVIQEGARKKFFREAPELGWLASSRFRGRNKYLDAALDRMPADPGEGVPAEARADAVFEAMEEETYPVGDVDKLHAATYSVLVELVGEKDAAAIVYGGTDLDPQQETDGLRGNEAGVVDKLASVLAGVELGAVENSYAVGELAAIYAAAAERGDAIVVLMGPAPGK